MLDGDNNLKSNDDPIVRSAVLSAFLTVCEDLNLDAVTLARSSGVDPVCLVRPDLPIPMSRVTALLELAGIESGNNDFGVRLGMTRGAPDVGPLSLLLREEPNLRAALQSLKRYLPTHSRSIRICLEDGGDVTLLISKFARTDAPFRVRQSTELVVTGLMQTIIWLLGPAWRPVEICFTHRKPRSPSRHDALLGCPVSFDSEFDGIVLLTSDLNRPLSTASSLGRKYAEAYLETLSRESRGDLHGTVKEIITVLLSSGRCSANAVARQIGIDRSTLYRRLAAQGCNYKSLVDDVRWSIAERSCHPGRNFAELADQLGFQSHSSFSRWFKARTGLSPRDFRASD